jgi:hypothetical protein
MGHWSLSQMTATAAWGVGGKQWQADIDADTAKEGSQFREVTIDALTFARWQVIRANGRENAQLPGSAKQLGGDIRALRGVAHILR